MIRRFEYELSAECQQFLVKDESAKECPVGTSRKKANDFWHSHRAPWQWAQYATQLSPSLWKS